MAEVAGLVIGGISLVAMFESCMNIFDYVDSGRNFTTGYQDAALDITMLGARLARWERTYRQNPPASTEDEGEKAEMWLEQISKRLQDARLTGEKYETSKPSVPFATAAAMILPSNPEMKPAARKFQMTDKIREKLLYRVRSPGTSKDSSAATTISIASKARWALRDEAKMNALIEKLTRYVSHLEAIFPALQPALEAGALEDASLIQPAEIEEPEDSIGVVAESALRVDPPLGHVIMNVRALEGAKVRIGDYISPEWAESGRLPVGARHKVDGLEVSGRAQVMIGNVYGGRSVLDD